MGRKASFLTFCSVLVGPCLLGSGALAATQSGYEMLPISDCVIDGVPTICVTFADGQLTGDSYSLPDKDGNVRAQIVSTSATDVWDTHGLVTLSDPALPDNTACAPLAGLAPMNVAGAKLFVQTDAYGDQTLYLIYGGVEIQRKLSPGWVKGTSDIAYLFAAAKDDADYDYYVEFVQEGTGTNQLKYYRVEAFPHLADQQCDAERPDVALNGSQVRSQKAGSGVVQYEASSGEGNEPNH